MRFIDRTRVLLVMAVVAVLPLAIVPLANAKKHHPKKVSPRTGDWEGYATKGGKCESPGGLGPEACSITFNVEKQGGKKFVTYIIPTAHGQCSNGSTNDFGQPVPGPGTANDGYATFQISKKGTFSGSGVDDSQYGNWISFSIKGKYGLYKNKPHSVKKKSYRFQGTYTATWYYGGSERSVTCHASHRAWRATYQPPGSIL